MLRAVRHLPAQELAHARGDTASIDTVILTSEQRRAAKGEIAGVKGTRITLALPRTPAMRTDDVLVLEDGRHVEVVAAIEPLCEVRMRDVSALARLAWQIGDRHFAVEVLPNRLRVRRDADAEKLLTSLGVAYTNIETSFEPEGGAYTHVHAHGGHSHAHT